jgi:very-short-patch-repair endonuclease
MDKMNSVQSKLDAARAELLDLGLRNPLINYKLLKARGVEIVDESPPDVYQILVQDSKVMFFLPKAESEEDDNLLFDDEVEDDLARYTDNKLQTDYSSTELQRRLLNTYYTARTAIEEQGVNTLYLALGMIQWYESESSDIPRHGPLILIPVEIDRTSVRASFRIRYTGEDIGTNLSLQEKLKSEFGIQFPDIPDVDDSEQSNIQNYYQTVSSAIESLGRWTVDESAIALGFFSFAKFLMYRDLDTKNWSDNSLSEHSVLQSVLVNGFHEPKPVIDDNVPNIDEHLNPANTYHVVDADSSQALAIYDVSQGRNLVIQGPPGTGKSQTITNLIAAAIAERKRVLFVAEKMAALEVVKRKLDGVGLGNACLELHSHKMNKKAVVDELKRVLDLTKPTTSEQEVESLIQKRDDLNSYCEAINTPIGESGITPYQAYGELLAVERRLVGLEIPTLDRHQFQHSAPEFKQGLERTELLQTHLKQMGVPKEHAFWGSRCKHFLPLMDRELLQRAAIEAKAGVIALKDSSAQLAQHLKLPVPDTCKEVEDLIRPARRALDTPDLADATVQSTEWRTHHSDLEIGLNAGERLSELHNAHDHILIPEAWEQNVLEIRQMLAAYGDKWWRIFSGKYRRARNELLGLCLQQLPKTQDIQLRMVDAILEAQRELPHLEKIQKLGQKLFGIHWQGQSSDWAQLREIVEYLSTLHESVKNGELPEALVAYLASNPDLEALKALVATVEEHQNNHPILLQTVVDQIQLDETVYSEDDGLKSFPFAEQAKILERWERESDKLQDIVTYNHLVEVLRDSGFTEIVKVANTWSKASEFLSDLLKRVWYSARVETAMREYPILAGFSSGAHQYIVKQFHKLDNLSLECNKGKVAYEHWKHLPTFETSSGQLGLLRREFEKKRRHLPIRQLMTKTGNAIQAIKPIFMMSPLSVATFLPPNSVGFDWVIFDEASQVKPVDAFGAIIRGKQTVVVGDTRQLPPTDFFDKQIKDVDEDAEENLTGDTESILGLFSAQNAPERMLRWHYRSRHESLITVSNVEFYGNKLQLFPSPDATKKEVGLVYHHLSDTAYDRGGSRSNLEEARIVAKKIMEHAHSYPDLTLGVATFSTAQMQAVIDQLELLRREDPSCEQTFFNANPGEPFFIKNLENVQGDERDVIFISIGYGRDANGKITMNFGPLNREGGERRLNVLITRARQRCEVFTNLTANDIDPGSANPVGVVALKRYLKYAETGELNIPELTGKPPDSPFEEEVAEALRSCSYEIDHQIGSAGYFIDLGVKDPEHTGRYLLGIECDGATYHSAQSARDRDRIRQEVLEGLGWRIHRIWSTDWFKFPDRELKKVAEAIEAAKAHIPFSHDKTSENNAHNPSKGTEEPKTKVDTIGDPTPKPRHDSLTEKYKLAELNISTNGHALNVVPQNTMVNWIQQVVEIESPVHLNEIAKRIASAVGVKKVGKRIREAIEIAARQAAHLENVLIKDKFLYWTEHQHITVRNRDELPNASRKLELIAPEEIQESIKLIVSESCGIEQDDLPHETCKLFGFKKVNENMRQGVKVIINEMIQNGELIERTGSLILANQT